jgi:hypothetical protein
MFSSSAVDTDQSIFKNWQEGGLSPVGFGTLITSSTSGDNGFDPTTTGNPSLFKFDNSQIDQSTTSAWFAIDNTDVNLLKAGEPLRIFVRGDINTELTNNAATPSPTVLRARGGLKFGNLSTGVELPVLSPVGHNFSFVANPFQAIVDLKSLIYDGDVNSYYVYVWDAKINGENGRGGYVTVDLTSTPAPDPSSSDANQYLMPGQGFFIRNNMSVSSMPGITFTEASKAVMATQNEIFSTESYLNIGLYTLENWQTNGKGSDAKGIRWSTNYTTEFSDEDTGKLGNLDENFAVENNGFLASIDKRLEVQEKTIPLYIGNFKSTDYVFYPEFELMQTDQKVYLYDQYLDMIIELENQSPHFFTVDPNIAESSASDRFKIFTSSETLSSTDFNLEEAVLYLVPTKDKLYIKVPFSEETDVNFYSQLGQLLFKKTFEKVEDSNNLELDLSSFRTGIYYVNIKN